MSNHTRDQRDRKRLNLLRRSMPFPMSSIKRFRELVGHEVNTLSKSQIAFLFALGSGRRKVSTAIEEGVISEDDVLDQLDDLEYRGLLEVELGGPSRELTLAVATPGSSVTCPTSSRAASTTGHQRRS